MFLPYQTNDETSNFFQNDEVLVLGEDDPSVITYSRSTRHSLYSYSEKKYSNLVVPYTTIKHAKMARSFGIREAVYEVFHRPDKSPLLRSMLDLWGFESYHNYLYTICELGFLEGLIPVIDFGFLTPDEIRDLMDVVAIIRCFLFTDYDCLMEHDGIRSSDRSYDIRHKVLSWASKMEFPISTGIFLHNGLEKSQIKDYAKAISEFMGDSTCIHDVLIQTQSRVTDIDLVPPSNSLVKYAYETFRNLIPENIPVIIANPTVDIVDMELSNGERDIGTFSNAWFAQDDSQENWDKLLKVVAKYKKQLQLRFPLRRSFIQDQRYSKKLGQIFDAYRYKIKKDLLEKQKSATP